MNDPQIREMLISTFLKKYTSNQNSLILEEVGIMNGDAIVDLVVFSKVYNQAFEIKSADDSLSRLPQQLDHYTKVFDYITIITQPSHLQEVQLLCPKFVGILLVYNDWDMEYVQKPTANPLINPRKLIQLLWRDEVYAFLRDKGFKGLSSASNAKVKKIACDNFSLSEIRDLVFNTLKTRPNWKTAVKPKL